MRSEKRRFFAPNKWFNDTSPNYVHGRDQRARGTVNSILNRFVSNYTPTHVVSVKTQAILLINHPWLQRIIISKYCFRTLLKTLWDNRGHENGVLHPSPHPVALCCHWGCPSRDDVMVDAKPQGLSSIARWLTGQCTKRCWSVIDNNTVGREMVLHRMQPNLSFWENL